MTKEEKTNLINNMLNCYLNETNLTTKEVDDANLFCDELQALNMHVVGRTLGCSFVLDPTTSSATKCICGKDKWEHEQAT